MPTDYNDATYWDERYTRNLTQQGFDWFIDRTNLKPVLTPILDVTCNILVVGYGQSNLGEELYDMGYKKITCLDFADAQVKDSAIRSKGANRDGVNYVTWDASAAEGLTFAHKPYDIVIDKGVLDCIVCEHKADDKAARYIANLYEGMNSSAVLLIITHGRPAFRKPLFEAAAPWHSITVKTMELLDLNSVANGDKRQVVEDYKASDDDRVNAAFLYQLQKLQQS